MGVHLAARREGRPADQHRPRPPGRSCRPGRTARAARSTTPTTAASSRASASPGRPARSGSCAARSGSSSTWRAPARTCRLPAEPAVLHRRPAELRRHDRRRYGRDRLCGHRPGRRRSGHALPHLRPGPAAPVHEAVESLRGAEADRRALGPGRVRRQPLEPHGRPVRLQPARPRESAIPRPGRLSRSGGRSSRSTPESAPTSGTNSIGVGAYDALQVSLRAALEGRPGVPRLLHLRQGHGRQRRLLRHRRGQRSRAGTTWTARTRSRTTDRRPTDVRHAFSFAANYEVPFGRGRKNGEDWSGLKNAVLGGWNVNTILMARTGFPITVSDGAGQSLQAPRTSSGRTSLQRRAPTRAARTTPGSTSAASSTRRAGHLRQLRRRHPARPRLLERRPRDQQELLPRRPALPVVQGRGVQRVQPSQLTWTPPREHRGPGHLREVAGTSGTAHHRAGAEARLLSRADRS